MSEERCQGSYGWADLQLYSSALSSPSSVAQLMRLLALCSPLRMQAAISVDMALWAAYSIRYGSRCLPRSCRPGFRSSRCATQTRPPISHLLRALSLRLLSQARQGPHLWPTKHGARRMLFPPGSAVRHRPWIELRLQRDKIASPNAGQRSWAKDSHGLRRREARAEAAVQQWQHL